MVRKRERGRTKETDRGREESCENLYLPKHPSQAKQQVPDQPTAGSASQTCACIQRVLSTCTGPAGQSGLKLPHLQPITPQHHCGDRMFRYEREKEVEAGVRLWLLHGMDGEECSGFPRKRKRGTGCVIQNRNKSGPEGPLEPEGPWKFVRTLYELTC